MSQFAPPHEPGSAAGDHEEALTPQVIEAVLADFRKWLEQTAQQGVRAEGSGVRASADRSPLDLHTLLSQFVALRHEVNLQTKASRAQQEHNAEALGSLEKALEALEDARLAPPADESLRPLLKTLVDLHDNLSLARREVLRTQETLTPLLERLAAEEPQATDLKKKETAQPSPQEPHRSWWARWFGGPTTQEAVFRAWQASRERSPGTRRAQEAALRNLQNQLACLCGQLEKLHTRHGQARDAASQVKRVVSSLLTGYTMSLNRVERALQHHELETIPTVGRPLDPETMEVLEVVHDAGRTNTEVIEEVRRGYRWRGQLFRFAQVRVARPLAS